MYIFGALEKEGYLLHAPEFYKLMKKEKIELKVGIPAISWLLIKAKPFNIYYM